MISLQSRLLLLMSISMSLIFSVVVWFSYEKGQHEVEEFLDGQLALSARLLEAQIHHLGSNGKLTSASTPERESFQELIEILAQDNRGEYEPELAFKIWDASGALLLQSNNANDMPRVPYGTGTDVFFNDRLWRISCKQSSDGTLSIQTAHPLDTRHRVGLDVAFNVMSPLLLGLPLLLVFVYIAIRNATKPIRLLSEKIQDRKTNDTTPIPIDEVIPELKPLINSFNLLLVRLNKTFANERHFTANAAHELRSPIAGIKIQAQLASQTNDVSIKDRAIANVVIGIRRCEKLIDQMLRLARLDPDQIGNVKKSLVSVKTLLMEVVSLESQSAKDQNQQILISDIDENLKIVCDYELMEIALLNLLSNAIKYSEKQGLIRIDVASTGPHVQISITDQGPGIPENEIGNITQRFARGKHDHTKEGSGLGLAIVDRIINIHEGQLELKNVKPSGLRVTITL